MQACMHFIYSIWSQWTMLPLEHCSHTRHWLLVLQVDDFRTHQMLKVFDKWNDGYENLHMCFIVYLDFRSVNNITVRYDTIWQCVHCGHLTVSTNSEDRWKRFCLLRTKLQHLVTLAFTDQIQILLLIYLLTYLLTYERPANRKFPFESNLELNWWLRFEFESNLESNQRIVVYSFNVKFLLIAISDRCADSSKILRDRY